MSDYTITIVKTTSHGDRNVHSYVSDADGDWWEWNPPNRGQRREHRNRLVESGRAELFDGQLIVKGRHDERRPGPRRQTVNKEHQPLKDQSGAVELADNFALDAKTLSVILDALRSDQRHEVNLADVNAVVSQLGSRIAKFNQLCETQQRLAEKALYKQIQQTLF